MTTQSLDLDTFIKELENKYPVSTEQQDYCGYCVHVIKQIEKLRRQLPLAQWQKFCERMARSELVNKFLESPIIQRCLHKPRGYAGDAVMMDYFYYGVPQQELEKLTPFGQAMSIASISSDAAHAARNRARLLAQNIMQKCHESKDNDVRVLSIACGHAREYSLISEASKEKLAGFHGFDQDAESINTASQAYQQDPRCQFTFGKIKDFIAGELDDYADEQFDIIYASGLFDYLSDDISKALINEMLKCTRPGGKVIVTNFTPDTISRGYMEAITNWYLIYRNLDDLQKLIKPFPSEETRYYCDPTNNIAFAELKKKSSLQQYVTFNTQQNLDLLSAA